MGRSVRDSKLETREARRKLETRKEPYWRSIFTGAHLGYYKGAKGAAWCVRVRHDGQYHYETIGVPDDNFETNEDSILNYYQAQDKAKQFAEKIFRGSDYDDVKAYTVRQAVEAYLKDFQAHGKKSLKSTATQINAHILPRFGDKAITSISFNQLNEWKNNLAIQPKRARTSKLLDAGQQYIEDNASDPEYQRKRRATANRILTILKAILNHAYNTNRVSSNESWKKLKPFRKVSEAKIRYLSEPETSRLLNACDLDFRQLVRAALLTGARYGELTVLPTNHYNAAQGTVFIADSKNGRPRHIPLNDEGKKFFDQIAAGKSPNEFMFTRSDNKQWKKNYQVRPLKAACEVANITPAISFHILRHTYASCLAMRGVPLQVISNVLGHSDTRITHKHYAHLMPSYIADVIKAHLPDFGKTEISNIVPLEQRVINSN